MSHTEVKIRTPITKDDKYLSSDLNFIMN